MRHLPLSSKDEALVSGLLKTFCVYKSAFFFTFITPVTAKAVFSMAFLICSFVFSSATSASLRVLKGTAGGTKDISKVLQALKKCHIECRRKEETCSDEVFILYF